MEVVKILLVLVVALISTHNVHGKENCFDTFTCNCSIFSSNPLVDVQFSNQTYEISSSTPCVLSDRTSITITGAPDGSTELNCTSEFNIVFNNSQSITISNITLRNCGGKIIETINGTITNAFYFGNTTYTALMFFYSTNITLNNVTILDSPGYSVIALNALGTVELSNVTIKFNGDPNLGKVDAGSGIAFLYTDQSARNSTLKICNSKFYNNTATISNNTYEIFLRQTNLGFTNDRITLLGAASVTIYYLHSNYYVSTDVTGTEFIENDGTFSGSVAIIQAHNAKSKTQFNNCTFQSNKGIREFSNSDLIRTGGIYFINYLQDINVYLENNKGDEFEVLVVSHCTFESLNGKLGAAFHIEKNALDVVHVVIRIEHCSFRNNSADTGSALYAKDRSTKLPYRPSLGGSLTISLVNISAENNNLSSGSSIQGATSNFITGVFYVFNCLVTLQCTEQCKFANNKPSVFYAYRSALTMSGNILFFDNKARFGGAIRLIDTVAYINVNSTIRFEGNNVTENGGAIHVEVPLTNIQSQDYCPFQFVGPLEDRITDSNVYNFKNDTNININVIFEDNHAGVVINDSNVQSDNTAINNTCTNCIERVESIYANVFYVCSWFPGTLVQTTIGPDTKKRKKDGTRPAVYHETFNYSNPNSPEEHLNILAILPCICSSTSSTDHANNCTSSNSTDCVNCTDCVNNCTDCVNNCTDHVESYSDYVNSCLNNQFIDMSQLNVIPGMKFPLKIVSIDTVGSVGYSSKLVSRAYISDNTNDSTVVFELEDVQLETINNSKCVEVYFTIYVQNNESILNKTGILSLSVAVPRVLNISFSFTDCPTGFEIRQINNYTRYACLCKDFVASRTECNANSGEIIRSTKQTWIGNFKGDIQYLEFCSPTLCNTNDNAIIDLNNAGSLCIEYHEGRGCGECKSGYSRVFGSDRCKEECDYFWLFTIPLYGLLGVILVVILFTLKFTVRIGLVNGLIFFCNVMSINEQLFFNKKINEFSFLRIFISIFNLDLGFEICFYKEMTELAKTGLQFIFPVYLWPLILVIVYMSRYSHRFQGRVSHTAVPVFATLILLSYAKLLRTAISAFSFAYVESESTTIRVWRPDPSVPYWHNGHAALFVIATLFLLFIFPFAISFTYPRILHYQKFSYLFPFFDCFTAPYKGKYRFWFGVRAVVLIYLALMETIIFEDKEALLLSNVVVVGTFAIVQAYIRPFKNTLINCSDLTFTAIFLLLSATVLYIHPTSDNSNSAEKVNTAVYVFGFVAFFLFCLIVAYHIHEASKKSYWYITTVEKFWNKVKTYKDNRIVNIVISSTAITKNASLNRFHQLDDNSDIPEEERFQESYYEQM